MRLPYVEISQLEARGSAAELAIKQRIQARRAPRPLQPLDLALLHSPLVADGWNSFIGAIRTKTSLPEDLREIAISRVAVKNRAWYEWGHHAPLAAAAGVTARGMKILETSHLPLHAAESGLTEKQLAVAAFTDTMTVHVTVPDEVFERVRGHFTDQEVVELTAIVREYQGFFLSSEEYADLTQIAAYNCVSRFLVALDVGERNSVGRR